MGVITDKKKMNYSSVDSLKDFQDVLTDAGEAIKDPTRTIATSKIPVALAGVLGGVAGGGVGIGGMFMGAAAGVHGGAAIMSGLASLGSIVGGGAVAGLGVVAAPAVIGAGLCVWIASKKQFQELIKLKEFCYKEALQKQSAIQKELNFRLKEREQALLKRLSDNDATLQQQKDRIEYLLALNEMLKSGIQKLSYDLGK